MYEPIERIRKAINNAEANIESLKRTNDIDPTVRYNRVHNLTKQVEVYKTIEEDHRFAYHTVEAYSIISAEILAEINEKGKIGIKNLTRLKQMSMSLSEHYEKFKTNEPIQRDQTH